jgi:hypothetical protein
MTSLRCDPRLAVPAVKPSCRVPATRQTILLETELQTAIRLFSDMMTDRNSRSETRRHRPAAFTQADHVEDSRKRVVACSVGFAPTIDTT